MRLFALFDWDKTVRFGGYVIFDFIKLLVENDVINKEIESEIYEITEEHKNGNTTYTEFAEKTIQIYREIY